MHPAGEAAPCCCCTAVGGATICGRVGQGPMTSGTFAPTGAVIAAGVHGSPSRACLCLAVPGAILSSGLSVGLMVGRGMLLLGRLHGLMIPAAGALPTGSTTAGRSDSGCCWVFAAQSSRCKHAPREVTALCGRAPKEGAVAVKALCGRAPTEDTAADLPPPNKPLRRIVPPCEGTGTIALRVEALSSLGFTALAGREGVCFGSATLAGCDCAREVPEEITVA